MKLKQRRRLRFQSLLNHYQRIDKKFNSLNAHLFKFLVWIAKSVSNRIEVDPCRFINANNLSYEIFDQTSAENPVYEGCVEIVVVAAEKDFLYLAKSLDFARFSLGHYFSGQACVIVPATSIGACLQSLENTSEKEIYVMSEDEIIEENDRKLLQSHFGNRYGWVLQQLLKVSGVLKSTNPYTLVVDADTLLLKKRRWIDSNGQLLLASWECNKPYYEFLSRIGIGEQIPIHTFVTHFMLFQKSLMKEALAYIGISKISQLIELIIKDESDSESPFCIEYELYGQYLQYHKKNHIRLEKWSNISVHRENIDGLNDAQILERYKHYSSISLHSFLSEKK